LGLAIIKQGEIFRPQFWRWPSGCIGYEHVEKNPVRVLIPVFSLFM
jgi:hypothetical protein